MPKQALRRNRSLNSASALPPSTQIYDFFEDRFAGGGPDERSPAGIICVEEGFDLSDEVFGAGETVADWAMRAAKTQLDLIELGCMGWHEPEVETRPTN